MVVLRSLFFNAAFYLVTAVMLIVTLPVFFFLPQAGGMAIVRAWAKTVLWLHKWIAGVELEVRGAEHMPRGAALVAAKHQSAFETIAVYALLRNPAVIMKQSLRFIPIFGQYTMKVGQIHVDRDGGTAALRAMTERAKTEVAAGREIVIFPEGSRRPLGAPTEYHGGVAFLYRQLKVPVVPVALNSGAFWPRKGLLHYPGTIVVEFLPPIEPGLDSRAFLTKLQDTIESASNRLVAEARARS
jgi:1-acyl-sn-glycerol-3-phosphate acyltransferase